MGAVLSRKSSTREVTIVDVAKEAGVSYSTVSRVVNNKTYVKPETRARVVKAMTRLGYQANLQARSLAGGSSNVIGLLVTELTTQYMGEIVSGIEEVLTSNQYELMLYTTHRKKARESAFVNMMARGLADGLLIVLPRDPEAYLLSLRERNFPYVLIDQFGIDDTDLSVTATNREGGYEATNHLISLGHRRIGMITGWMDMISSVHRLEGYRSALGDHRIAYDEQLIYTGDFTHTSGYVGANTLLDLADPPTAIFASNDMGALGVMDAVRDRGMRVATDISIVGFDDVPIAAALTPPLTTVRQPLSEMGLRATQMLVDLIQEPEKPQRGTVLPTTLIIRGSTAPPRI